MFSYTSQLIDMGPYMDFLYWLEPDMSIKVLTYLDDPSDLGRICSVSRTWRHIVVENGLSKKLCLRMFPQLSSVAHAIELDNPDAKEYAEVGSSNTKEWDTLEKEHRVYGLLAHACTSFTATDCKLRAICASSTDNYPEEGIQNTLHPNFLDLRDHRRISYWSSKGQKNPAVPEMLTYKLESDFLIITEINIHPFQAFFQPGLPIYSASGVQFRMGHAKSPIDGEIGPMEESCHDDKYEWTYTSQVFPMAQENRLQTFKLPEPVLCIGGIFQIELMGRVQRQEMDDLFYICVGYVQVKGQSLSPAFGVETNVPSGLFVLKKNMQAKSQNQPSLPENESDAISTSDLGRHVREMLPIVHMMRGNVVDFEEDYAWDDPDWDEAEDETDEEFVI